MMTKQSSQLKMLFKKIAIIPIAMALLFIFANRVEAKEMDEQTVLESEIILQEKVTPKMIAEYNAFAKKYNSNSEIVFKKEEIQRLKYIYSLMSEKQKETAEAFPNIPPPPPPAPEKVVKRKLLPPPPPRANSTPKQLKAYNEAMKKYKNEIKNIPPPPPPAPKKAVKGKLVPPPSVPANATKAQKEKYKKAIEKYNKQTKNIPPPAPTKAIKKA